MSDYKTKLHQLIPGGAHTYSRGDDQYPANAPAILDYGKGAYVFDADGNKYLDYGMGLRSITLGYDHESISEAAYAEIKKGNNLTRASLTELRAAEKMIELFPWADMVKFAKNGSTVTTAAVKLARAYTNKKYVAICAEHPFFTFDDWFIGTTPMDKGVPEENKNLSLKFNYNNIASLEQLFETHPNQIACVILEPGTFQSPCSTSCHADLTVIPNCVTCPNKNQNFLHQVKALCKKHNAIFILDEMITGFRFDTLGAQKIYDIEPDLATFGKGMANGFPLAALIGKKEIMNQGGILEEGKERLFLISTTHGSEMSSLGAFLKTIEEYKNLNVTNHLWDYGKALIDGANAIAKEFEIEEYFYFAGFGCSPAYFTKDKNKELSLGFRTLFAQEMMKQNIMIPWVALSYAHQQEELDHTLKAITQALKIYKKALNEGLENYLVGDAIKPVFRKFN